MKYRLVWFLFATAAVTMTGSANAQSAIVIAHRGASGYLPEHTLAAAALAHGMRADFIEQDIVLSKDDHPLVLHDIHLDTVTNVAERFPDRARVDGRYYALDFTLAEIKTLRVTERLDLKTSAAAFPHRFPAGKSSFQVATLQEQIELIQGLNKSTQREVGIYPEIKSPAWHRGAGKDISQIVLQVLAEYGYRDRSDNAFVQCFDVAETKRVRRELGCQLRLIQLIGDNSWDAASTDYDRLRTPAGLREIAGYADGIGPWLPHVIEGRDEQGRVLVTPLVEQAHAQGLQVHPYTFRADALPDYVSSSEELLRILFQDVGVDGLFTDFPDIARQFRDGGER